MISYADLPKTKECVCHADVVTAINVIAGFLIQRQQSLTP